MFSINFHPGSEKDGEDLLIMNSLVYVDSAVKSLVESLKIYFDDSQKRLCFFSAHKDGLISDVILDQEISMRKKLTFLQHQFCLLSV